MEKSLSRNTGLVSANFFGFFVSELRFCSFVCTRYIRTATIYRNVISAVREAFTILNDVIRIARHERIAKYYILLMSRTFENCIHTV